MNYLPFYDINDLEALDKEFLLFLKSSAPHLYESLINLRENPEKGSDSELICNLSIILESFLSKKFDLDVSSLYDKSAFYNKAYYVRRQFVQRVAWLKPCDNTQEEEIQNNDIAALENLKKSINISTEEEFVKNIYDYLKDEEKYENQLKQAHQFCRWIKYNRELFPEVAAWSIFKDNLRDHQDTLVKEMIKDEFVELPYKSKRMGFERHDFGLNFKESSREANYCIICHKQGKDSCRTGLKDKNLQGCPLDQKISEMNLLRQEGRFIAALSVIMLDNPMVAATGHRICNACMRSCIYQKQDAVNIPGVETEILETVLNLNYGPEIYILLARWNPLNLKRPYVAPNHGRNIRSLRKLAYDIQMLEAPHRRTGAYPSVREDSRSGVTTQLSAEVEFPKRSILIVGMGPSGFGLAHQLLQEGHKVVGIDGLHIKDIDVSNPIKSVEDLAKNNTGFGGVLEYGITVRWNKIFLNLIYATLKRYSNFSCYGGVRLGSNLTIDDAWAWGFDHIALAIGAGKPKIPQIKGLDKAKDGVLIASNFLMHLNTQKPYQKGALAELKLEGPIVVVGSGLTAVDAAVEAKFYISENVTIVSRGSVEESNAFKLNYQEVRAALESGISWLENHEPIEIISDDNDKVIGLSLKNNKGKVILPAKTILLATGTYPNVAVNLDNPELFEKDGDFLKIQEGSRFLVYSKDGRSISALGDAHKDFYGSVVHALASAKDCAVEINYELQRQKNQSLDYERVKELVPKVVKVERFDGKYAKVIIEAKNSSKHYRVGEFFRLTLEGDVPAESMPVMPVSVENGFIELWLISAGLSSDYIVNNINEGSRISLMGPTGSLIKVPNTGNGEWILLVSGHALLPFVPTLKNLGYKVAYLYPESVHREIINKIEQNADESGVLGEVTLDHNFSRSYVVLNNEDFKLWVGEGTGIIYTKMQCMMKGICASCIKFTYNENTGNVEVVYACENPYFDIAQ